jgi:hypothetical protein
MRGRRKAWHVAIFIRRITWIDAAGGSRTTAITGNASVVAVQLALQNESNGDYATESEAQLFANATPAPVVATYQDVADEADLWYTTSGGTIVQITLPAPKASVFLADQETVDATQVAGITATAIGVVVDPGGNAVVAFLGGRRNRQR